MLDEFNDDVLEFSAYLHPKGRIGHLGRDMFQKIVKEFFLAIRAGRARRVPRI